jgi:hypothetical protein
MTHPAFFEKMITGRWYSLRGEAVCSILLSRPVFRSFSP